jgi:acetyl esterase/lipase
MKRLITISIFLSFSAIILAVEITKSTFIYSVKEKDTLRLDKYEIGTEKAEKPCIIFLFGGGFIGGKRDNEKYLNYFQKLAQSGYVVVSIDYRLGLKSTAEAFKRKEKVGSREIVKRLNNAINLAVEDLYDATNYILLHNNEWKIDPKTLIISGSSAGAIAALQAEYYIHSDRSTLPQKLPPHFDYAGIISFAGAIFSTKGSPKWTSHPSPILFFHGDADRNVPYEKAKIFSIGFFGSKHLANQLDEMGSPYQFFSVENVNHSIAETPMWNNLPEIERFIKEWAIEKKQQVENTRIKNLSLPDVPKKYGIKDYIKSNF